MIDFACKKFNVNDVIKCSLGLTKAEFEIFNYMLESKKDECSSSSMAKIKNLDLSTVQRTLKKLMEKDIAKRRQVNLGNGGYEYFYRINDRKKICDKIILIIHDWSTKVEKEVKQWKNKNPI